MYRQRHSRHLWVFLLAVVAVFACTRGQESGNMARDEVQVTGAPAASPDVGFAGGRAMAPMAAKVAAEAATEPAQSQQLPSVQDSVAPNMLIRSGNVSIEVDSLEIAIASVRALATKLGGYVGNISMTTGAYEVRSATLELRIPATRFDEAVNTLGPIGRVEFSNSTAQDVGEEFVDVNARVANSKRLEERLVSLLATRTGKLEDVLAVERELARVREEIERYEGRIRFLKTRVATSTLSVTVHEKAPLVSSNPGTNVIAEAFRDMWRNFVRFIATIISSLGVVIPLLVIATGIVWWFRRRRTPPTT